MVQGYSSLASAQQSHLGLCCEKRPSKSHITSTSNNEASGQSRRLLIPFKCIAPRQDPGLEVEALPRVTVVIVCRLFPGALLLVERTRSGNRISSFARWPCRWL